MPRQSRSSDVSVSSGNPSLLQIIVEELQNDDEELRIASLQRLGTICSALGPRRSRAELLPFLKEILNHESDLALYTIATELSNLVPLIGGPSYAHHLLPLLNHLISEEEIIVREAAISSIKQILPYISPERLSNHFIPFLLKLVDEWFISRASLSSLICPTLIHASEEDRARIYSLIERVASDSTPFVRRSLCSELPCIISVVHQKCGSSEFYSLVTVIKLLSEDEYDNVRLMAVKGVVAMVTAGSKNVNDSLAISLIESCLTVIKTLINDRSWRVRYSVAENFSSVIDSFSSWSRDCVESLVKIFGRLMKDPEKEVRVVASEQLEGFFERLNDSVIISYVIPLFNSLLTDSLESVKIFGVELLLKCSKFCKDELLQSLYDLILSDRSITVKMKFISTFPLKLLLKHSGYLIKLEKLVKEAISHSNWHVRHQLVSTYSAIVENICPVNYSFFMEKIFPQFTTLFKDPVFIVRETLFDEILKSREFFGKDWLIKTLYPILSSIDSSSYLIRIFKLRSVSKLSRYVDRISFEEVILPFIVSFYNDRIANVRFNVLRTVNDVFDLLPSELLESLVKPCLEKLCMDSDDEVSQFAQNLIKKSS
ncbi:hypothetical protein P9112_002342 [Eukaryota sp. TZLM1-RC]